MDRCFPAEVGREPAREPAADMAGELPIEKLMLRRGLLPSSLGVVSRCSASLAAEGATVDPHENGNG